MKHITKSAISLTFILGFLMMTTNTYAQRGSCVSGDCYNGVGTYLWPNGEKYVGSFSGSQMHGRGTYDWPNGHRYEGDWERGRQHGTGTYSWANGKSKYSEWQNGMPIRELTQNSSTAPPTTVKTTGCVSGNCENGRGLYIWTTGERYEGSWSNGKFEGYGSYTWSDGSKYSGNWSAGNRSGQGTFYETSGKSKTGTWKDNELAPTANNRPTTTATTIPTTPTTSTTRPTTTATTYTGTGCVKGNCNNGIGVYIWKNGERYEGKFSGGRQNGSGTYSWPDKSKYVGEWKNARRHGKGVYFFPDSKRKSGIWRDGVITQEITNMVTPKVASISGTTRPTSTTTRPTTTTTTTTTRPTTTITRPPTTASNGKDKTAPEVTITEPAVSRGFTVVTKGNVIRVRGYATDATGVSSVWVGGVAATLTNPGAKRTDFQATVTLNVGQRDLWLEAVDTRGNEYTHGYTLKVENPLAPSNTPSGSQDRVALIIGNSSYNVSPLPNARNDADSVAKVLNEVGFDVAHYTDLNYQQMEKAIDEYGEKLRKNGGVGMFYFAGHGVQVNGENYLVPVSANIKKEKDIKYKSVHLGYLLDEFEGSGNDMNIIVLDACRDNPFAAQYRSARNGLAGIAVPPIGTFIAYATSPGSVASDGEGTNGLYTQELIKALRHPKLKIEDVFKVVRANVRRLSQGMQVPWENSSIEGDFYFRK